MRPARRSFVDLDQRFPGHASFCGGARVKARQVLGAFWRFH
jgi:hypothetical protein